MENQTWFAKIDFPSIIFQRKEAGEISTTWPSITDIHLSKPQTLKKSSHFYVEILPACAGLVGRLNQTWPSGQHMLFPLILFTRELMPPLTNLPHHAERNVIQKGKYYKKNCNTTRNKIKTMIMVVWQNVPDFDDSYFFIEVLTRLVSYENF